MIKNLNIGQIVHYIDNQGNQLAAIITYVFSDMLPQHMVCLHVLKPFGEEAYERKEGIPHSSRSEKKNTWHFIETPIKNRKN